MKTPSRATRIKPWLFITALSISLLTLFGCSSDETSRYTVGGSVTGTSGSGLVLQLNGGSNLALNADGAFTFSTALDSGSRYTVTALSYPTGQTCQVSNGSGNVSANVSNVSVACLTNGDPSGYYTNTGSATVGDSLTTNPLAITDFQAIVQDNRFMAMSVANRLVYDGPLEMFGDTFTAIVSVYRDGVMLFAGVNVSGTVVEGESISGSFEDTEEGAGSFVLDHSMDASTASVLRVQNDVDNTFWTSFMGGSTSNARFALLDTGQIQGYDGPLDGNLAGCTIYSVSGGTPVAVSPIANTSLYRITIQLSFCTNTDQSTVLGTAGYYTGFATSRSDTTTADDTLVFIVTSANGQYTASGDFK